MVKLRLFLVCFLLAGYPLFGQVILYEDQLNGCVTGGSFSSGTNGTGSGVIEVHKEPFATVRKAYLIAGRLGPAPAFSVSLNALTLTFDNSNQATPTFNTSLYGGASAVHAIDITSQINPGDSIYNISYSQTSAGTNFFTDFYLYIAYERSSLPLVNTVIFLKTLDFAPIENYTLTVVNPIDTLVPVGFAMHAGYMCDSASDGENIHVEGSMLGTIGGGDPNNPPFTCSGVSGSFYYESNTLYGINGDEPDQNMHGAEALSDISQVILNNTTTFDVEFEHVGGSTASPDNSMWAWILTYGNSNLQPTAIFTAPNDICPGTCTDFTSLSLNATSFQWNFPGASPSVSTDENPSVICYNNPGQYDVMLIATNANGSDTLTLPNYITVFPYPAPQGISQNGDTLFAIQGAVAYQWYVNGNIIPGATDYFHVASASGNYNVVATDANGCEVEAVIFDVIASVEDNHISSPMFIFPNPAEDKIYFEAAWNSIRQVAVYNVTGEMLIYLETSEDASSWIDISGLSEGIYFMEVVNGQNVIRLKFIKR